MYYIVGKGDLIDCAPTTISCRTHRTKRPSARHPTEEPPQPQRCNKAASAGVALSRFVEAVLVPCRVLSCPVLLLSYTVLGCLLTMLLVMTSMAIRALTRRSSFRHYYIRFGDEGGCRPGRTAYHITRAQCVAVLVINSPISTREINNRQFIMCTSGHTLFGVTREWGTARAMYGLVQLNDCWVCSIVSFWVWVVDKLKRQRINK